jgi:hypothetical protein
MSNALAIAAVTSTLRNLLQDGFDADPDLPGVTVTTKPLDKARGANDNGSQVNLFLYQTMLDGAWRNRDMPGKVKPGETGFPPLPLTLAYLVTAYGLNNDDVNGHHLLGRAMSILHDHPLLGAAEIQAALPKNDLHEQIERVRLTPQPLSLEELSKLWTTFQTQYRISAAYQASAVLIESTRPVVAAPPVLRRGSEDRGAFVDGTPAPVLTEARPPAPQPGVRLGEELTLLGLHLEAEALTARITSPRLPAPVDLVPSRDGDRLKVLLAGPADDPGALDRWAPGPYTVALIVQRPGLPPWTADKVVELGLAPVITRAPATVAPGDVLTVTCSPRLRPGQGVLLLLGGHPVTPKTVVTPADPTLPSSLDFTVPALPADDYVVRLRVDGVDSLPNVLAGVPPLPQFDPDQKVKVS